MSAPVADHRAARRLLTDLKAAMTMTALHDADTTAAAWQKLHVCLKTLCESGWFPAEMVALLGHVPADVPETLWRCDRGLWEATLYFVPSVDTAMMLNFAGGGDVSVCLRAPAGTRAAGPLAPTPEIEATLDALLLRHERGEGSGVGRDSVIALWVARGYDTMQRVAQLRQLAADFGASFRPKLAIHAVGNLLDPAVALPFAREVQRIEKPGDWRKRMPLDTNLCECIKYDHRRHNEFHKEILEFIRFLSMRDDSGPIWPEAAGDGRFRVFISIEAEKRQMTNQQDFFVRLLGALRAAHGPLDVLVNGMTGNVEGVDFFTDIRDFEAAVITHLQERLPDCRFLHMHNRSFAEKASACRTLDFYTAPIGTAMLIPLALQTPGVVYNSPEMLKQFLWFLKVMPSRTTPIDPAWTQSVQGDLAMRKYPWGWQDNSRTSYQLDVEKVIALCVEQSRQSDGAPLA